MKKPSDYLNELARESKIFHELSAEEAKMLKDTFLKMYQDIRKVCDDYQLKLLMSGGTCLGTVRHQGFIPWDDDLDVMMSREDYDKFISIFERELSDKYEMSLPRNWKVRKGLFMRIYKKGTVYTSIYNRNHRQLCNGIYLDVFPIERMPDNKFIRSLKCVLLDTLRICAVSVGFYHNNDPLYRQAFSHSLFSKTHYWCRKIIGFFCSILGGSRLSMWFDMLASNSKGTLFRSIPTGRGMSRKECHPTEVFFPPKKAMFEGVEVLIPNNADEYLSALYGDYMKVPPPEKRERHFYLELDFGDKNL